MPKTITVNKAIWRGRLTVTLPLIIIFLSVFGTAVYLVFDGFGRWVFGIAFLFCMLVLPFYQAIMATKWYIWAFSSVRNVHELRQRAIFERLILNKRNFLLKSAFISHSDQETIVSIEKKFDVPDDYEDDPKIPAVTKIYVSKTGKVFLLLVMLICFAAGLSLLFIAHIFIVGSILCLASGYLIFDAYRSISNSQPQIVISSEGIETTTSGFHYWKEIKNEIVGIEGDTDYNEGGDNEMRRGTYYYLAYDFNNGKEKMPVYDLRITHWKLAKLLRIYRSRSELISG